MKLTSKLVKYLHRVFVREPQRVLALRLNYTGAMTWTIADGVLTTSVSGVNLTVNLASYTLATLNTFLAAQPGYSVPYYNSDYAARSAMVLLDGTNTPAVSNGDHLYLYESLLWVYLDAVAVALTQVKTSIAAMILQMDMRTASGEWLDDWGRYFGVTRKVSESDAIYSPRMTGELFSVRSNNRALEAVIYAQTGLAVSVTDIDWWPKPREVQLVRPATVDSGFAGQYVSISESGAVLVASRAFDGQNGTQSGAVNIYERVNGVYDQYQKVFPPTPSPSDKFGSQVAVSGDGATVVIAASGYRHGVGSVDRGAVFVYVKQFGSWSLQATLFPLEIVTGDQFGWSIAVSRDGSTIVATSPFNSNGGIRRGAAWVFNRIGVTWVMTQKLSASVSVDDDQLGYSAALSKDGLVCFVGALILSLEGRVYAYQNTAGVWSQSQILSQAVPVAGNYFGVGRSTNPTAYQYNALACSATGEYLAAGAWGVANGGTQRGSCFVFVRSGTWSLQQTVVPVIPYDGTVFGGSVSIDDAGTSLLIGAQAEDVPLTNCGAAYYVRRNGGTWGTPLRILPAAPGVGSYFGYTCFLTGDGATAAISASNYPAAGVDQGAIYILDLSRFNILKKLGLDAGVAAGTPPTGGYPYWGLQVNNNPLVGAFAVLMNVSPSSLTQATKDTIKVAVEKNRAAGTLPIYYAVTGTLLITNTAGNNTNNLTYLSAPLRANYQQVVF